MKISPLEIRKKTFEKNFRGYDKEEVDAYLLSLSQEWERVMDESRELKIKVASAEKEVQKLREVESTLYKTLKTAEDTGVNIVGQANKTAELLTKESQMNAEAMLSDARTKARYLFEDAEEKVRSIQFQAQNKVNEIVIEIKSLENQKQNLVHELKQFAQSLIDRANMAASSSTAPDFNKMLYREESPKPLPLEPKVVETAIEEPKEENASEVVLDVSENKVEEKELDETEEKVSTAVPPKIEERKEVISFFDQF